MANLLKMNVKMNIFLNKVCKKNAKVLTLQPVRMYEDVVNRYVAMNSSVVDTRMLKRSTHVYII